MESTEFAHVSQAERNPARSHPLKISLPLWAAVGLGLAVALRLYLVFALPFGWTVEHRLEGLNDEPSHFNYTRYLSEHHRLPVQTHSSHEPDAFVLNQFEYHQPPVYYLLCVPANLLLGDRAGLYTGRVISFLFGLAGLALLFATLRRLGAAKEVCWGAVAFVALWLNHAYFSSVFSNDTLSWFFALLICWEAAVYARDAVGDGGQVARAARIGLWLGIGLWVKSSLAIFGPALVVLYGYLWWQHRSGSWLKSMAITLGIALVIAAPWYLRNLLVYHELFSLNQANGAWQRSLFIPADIVDFVKRGSYHFWFPMIHVPPSRLNGAFNAMCAVLLAIFSLLALLHLVRRRPADAGHVFLLTVLLLNLAGYLKYNLHWHNEDGRFLFPSLAALTLLIFAPLNGILGRIHRHLFPLAVYLLALFSWLPLLLV